MVNDFCVAEVSPKGARATAKKSAELRLRRRHRKCDHENDTFQTIATIVFRIFQYIYQVFAQRNGTTKDHRPERNTTSDLLEIDLL
jgi:hypothetical protein